MPMPVGVSQLRSLIGGLSSNDRLLPNLAKRRKLVTDVSHDGSSYEFTKDMERLVINILQKLSKPPYIAFSAW